MPIKSTGPIKAIGVDRGGTWTRVTAFDARLRPARTARLRTSSLRSLPGALKKILSRWPGGPQAALVIATRGAIGRKWKRPFLFKALKQELNLVDVISDAEAAHFAAFAGKAGILLIAGTGAVAFSGKPGAYRLTGGSNPPSGDPGSGRWLGRRYLELLGRLDEAAALGHGGCAAYAAKALARAQRGHPACATLIAAAQHELASLLAAAAGEGPVKAALAGGLMNSAYFRNGFLKAARLALPGRPLVFVKLRMTAEAAAARLALLRRKKR
ncbi:MAG TPA: hypothetical protein DCZ92_08120 [Elusimicrobia bacterium]|nr:hypothetical protein [Elusimicrobiota bacterium]